MANDDKLKMLGQTAADVPEATVKLVDEVATAVASLEQAFPADLFVLSDKEDRLTLVDTRVRNFITENEKEYGELQEDVKGVVGVLEEMAEAMSEGSQGLFNEYDKLVSEVNALGTYLSQETARVTTSMDGLQRVRGEMDMMVEVRMPALTGDYQELLEKYPEVEQSLKTLQSTCEEGISTLFAGVNAQGENIDRDQTVMKAQLASVAETLLEEINKDYEKAKEVLESLDAEGEKVVQERLLKDATLKFENMQALIKSHDRAIEELMDNTSEARSLAQPALNQIEAISKELEGLIDKVKEVAQTFSSSL